MNQMQVCQQPRRSQTAVLLAGLLLLSGWGHASDRWHVEGLSISGQEQHTQVRAATLTYNDWQLDELVYECPGQVPVYPLHQCAEADVSFRYAGTTIRSTADSRFDWTDQHWQVSMNLYENQLKVQADADWSHIRMTLDQLQPQALVKQWLADPGWIQDVQVLLSGLIEFDLDDRFTRLTEGRFEALNHEYSDDIIVADLSGSFSVDWQPDTDQLVADVRLQQGEMLFDQLYVNFASYPLHIQLTARDLSTESVAFDLTMDNRQSLQLQASGHIHDQTVKWDQLAVQIPDSHHFNQQILASVLSIYGFGQTQMSGGLSLRAEFDDAGKPRLWDLVFDDYYVLNNRRKIQADALTGAIHWQQADQSAQSALHWQHLTLAGMPVEASQVAFTFSQDRITLNGAHDFPVFDGSIQVRDFTAERLFSEAIDLSLNATIEPISLRLITEKLGWPPMSGSISGEIPGLVKKDQVIQFLGGLQLTVFQGRMQVENLSMERLFGVAPVIAADVSFNGFDLAQLTETFGFGRITGLLSGEVNDLRITNWKTDRLDARIYTVKTKGVKQTISQRAIENISSLGGIKGAISNTFLRFFDDFSYRKIKLSCLLHNSVCKIGGLKNQGNQFVIVEGGGIPKINIVGFVRSINWEEFIDRLLNANYGN